MQNGKVPLAEALRKHGVRRACRETGISPRTMYTTMYGKSLPKKETAERIAGALELELGDIAWPCGFGETVRIVDAPDSSLRTTPVQQQSSAGGGVEHSYSRERFEEMVNREVERRLAVAGQSMGDVRTSRQDT